MRFLGKLGLEGLVPDAKTRCGCTAIQLTQAGVSSRLWFETFDGYLKDQGYLAMGGQIIDASDAALAVPKQRATAARRTPGG